MRAFVVDKKAFMFSFQSLPLKICLERFLINSWSASSFHSHKARVFLMIPSSLLSVAAPSQLRNSARLCPSPFPLNFRAFSKASHEYLNSLHDLTYFPQPPLHPPLCRWKRFHVRKRKHNWALFFTSFSSQINFQLNSYQHAIEARVKPFQLKQLSSSTLWCAKQVSRLCHWTFDVMIAAWRIAYLIDLW